MWVYNKLQGRLWRGAGYLKMHTGMPSAYKSDESGKAYN